MLKIRRNIKVYGIVQGIGFRPFVKRTADRFRIVGDVCNKGSYVEIHAEGRAADVENFQRSLREDAPKVAHIIRMEAHSEVPRNESMFRIIHSVAESGEMFVSPDLAVCPECKKELFDPRNRRYLHPFINCTNCGPRLTILDSMPYDRVRTTMGRFPMCDSCSYEYTHPQTRRYHAQPVCCNEDGPQLKLILTKHELKKKEEQNTVSADKNQETRRKNRNQALIGARKIIREGGILAVKGIGGFHLACDAANEGAVARLRRLKRRPMKPFAVMMRDLDTVRRECEILPGEEEILDGVEKPILILNRRKTNTENLKKTKRQTEQEEETIGNGNDMHKTHLAASVAPDNPTVGVMLPYAPVQLLLFSFPDGKPMTDMLVMTSGNPSGAPICRTTEDAVKYLSHMCDAILTNDREILTRADDSVMQFEEGRPYMIRRSRGYAPVPFFGQESLKGQVLAIGGELKNTFVLAKNELYYPSAYIGDMEDARSIEALSETIPRMERLLEVKPEMIACDLHPGYHSTAFAKKYAAEHDLPIFEVQHHYAHILSCMAEHNYEKEVIGISFDGTGYGTDGTVWGGEFLKASPAGFVRLGSIQPFLQAGGDTASKEGWRIAVSLMYQMYAEEETAGCGSINEMKLTESEKKNVREKVERTAGELGLCDSRSLEAEIFLIEHNMNCIESTSVGRLFDAVSAILGIRKRSTFEGEASMTLEYEADPKADPITEPEAIRVTESEKEKRKVGDGYSDRKFVYRNDILLRKLIEGVRNHTPVSSLAGGFHSYLSYLVLDGARKCRERTGISAVVLSGGCFQNLLLLRKCKKLLREDGFRVLTHSLTAPNDGGIALGQAWAAMYRINTD